MGRCTKECELGATLGGGVWRARLPVRRELQQAHWRLDHWSPGPQCPVTPAPKILSQAASLLAPCLPHCPCQQPPS